VSQRPLVVDKDVQVFIENIDYKPVIPIDLISQEKIAAYESKINLVSGNLSEANAEILRLRQKLQDSSQVQDSLKNDLQTQSQATYTQQKSLEELVRENESLRKSLRTAEDERNSTLRRSSQQETELRQALTELTKLASVSDKLRTVQQERDNLEAELLKSSIANNSSMTYTVAEHDINSATAERLKMLQTAVDTKNAEILKSAELLERERAQLQKKDKAIRGYQEELMMLQKKYQEMETKYDELAKKFVSFFTVFNLSNIISGRSKTLRKFLSNANFAKLMNTT
jgi:chromosome segregation ATPase